MDAAKAIYLVSLIQFCSFSWLLFGIKVYKELKHAGVDKN